MSLKECLAIRSLTGALLPAVRLGCWKSCLVVRRSGILASLILTALLSPLSSGGLAWDVVLPYSNTRAVSGLTVKVDARWVTGNGYHPVRVFVGPLGGVARADRTVTVRLKLQAYPHRVAVQRTIELPQGSRGVVETLAAPLNGSFWTGEIEVKESGRILPDLTTKQFSVTNTGGYSEYRIASVLFIDADAPLAVMRGRSTRVGLPSASANSTSGGSASKPGKSKLPDMHVFVRPFQDDSMTGSMSVATTSSMSDGGEESRFEDRDIMRIVENSSCLEMLPPGEIPDRWIELTAFDMIFVDWADLEGSVWGLSERWQAIEDWVDAGGTLVVFGVGPDSKRLEQLGASFGSGQAKTGLGPWKKPSRKRFGQSVEGLDNVNRYMGGMGTVTVMPPANSSQQGKPSRKARKPKLAFRMCNFGMGKIVAIESENPFPGRAVDWAWFLNTLRPTRWQWEKRHGMSPTRANPDMWTLLVPGVGTPPVGTFLVLISVFIILAGPVNYLVLRRYKRLYLLLVTVPAAAAVVTVGVFAYAILADGLGVKVRIRSITLLDQRRGRAVSWSRQTYYASLVPSGGLVFPETAAVYPVVADAVRRRTWNSGWELVWEPEQQRLVRGYMRSRIPAQFLVIQPTASSAHLSVQATDSSQPGGGIGAIQRVTNQLGTRVDQVLLCSSARTFYWAEGIESGAGITPEKISPTVATERLTPLFNANRPALPAGFDPANNRSFFMGGFRMFGSWNDCPGFASSLLEVRMREASAAVTQLPPHSYVAIVQDPEQVPVGVEGAEHLACFHVIIGRW